MGFPFRRSHVFSRETRHNQRDEERERVEAAERARAPKLMPVERPLTDAERKEIVEMQLRDRGVFPPRNPEEICYVPHTDQNIREACLKGAIEGLNNAQDLKLTSATGNGGFGFFNCVKSVTTMFWSDVRKEVECRERREPDYQKDKRKYQAEYDYELSKVPQTGKVLEHVPITDPRHPYYVKPAPSGGPAPNNWETEFTTDGRNIRVRTRYRF
jgi:hypothetical protein